jgi:hypothetical protein
MRRMLIPLAGLLLSSVVGCTCVRGKCDCDFIPVLGCDVYHVKPIDLGLKGGCATCSGGSAGPVAAAGAPEMVPVAPTPLRPEPIKEMPRVVPEREEEQQQQQ